MQTIDIYPLGLPHRIHEPVCTKKSWCNIIINKAASQKANNANFPKQKIPKRKSSFPPWNLQRTKDSNNNNNKMLGKKARIHIIQIYYTGALFTTILFQPSPFRRAIIIQKRKTTMHVVLCCTLLNAVSLYAYIPSQNAFPSSS